MFTRLVVPSTCVSLDMLRMDKTYFTPPKKPWFNPVSVGMFRGIESEPGLFSLYYVFVLYMFQNAALIFKANQRLGSCFCCTFRGTYRTQLRLNPQGSFGLRGGVSIHGTGRTLQASYLWPAKVPSAHSYTKPKISENQLTVDGQKSCTT